MNREIRRAAKFKRAQRTLPYAATDAALGPLRLLNLARPYDEGAATDEHLKTRAAYDRLIDGTADTDDFDRVAMALNVAKVRATDIDETLADLIERSQDAMCACGARYDRVGRFGFDGPALQVMASAMEAHETITNASSPLQMIQALQAVQRVLALQGV